MFRWTGNSGIPGMRGAAVVMLAAGMLAWPAFPAPGQTPIDAGFRDFNYGGDGNSTPSGDKPENKLWFNDGSWWGSLWNDEVDDYHIYRLDLSTNTWIDTGTVLDTRSSKADVLWDEASQKLYVASHVFSNFGNPNTGNGGRLFRYSYSGGTYTRDNATNVAINEAKTETLTLAKDSDDRLWATWVDTASTDAISPPPGPYRVMVNHSTTGDFVWGTPFQIPGEHASDLGSGDISAIIAFDGKIGVMWSDATTSTRFFAVHEDGDADDEWSVETVAPNCTGACSDDLMDLKADASGRVFAAIKTSLGDAVGHDPDAPLVMLAIREVDGTWTGHTFGRVRDHHTRPKVLLDEANGTVYIFATHDEDGGAIYYKSSPMDPVSFPVGLGTPFIVSATDPRINNATSSRQNPTSESGIVVLASEQNTHFYFHNHLPLEEPSDAPQILSFSPPSGPEGTGVTITGTNFTGATSVTFNGTAAPLTSVTDTEIETEVPVGASTGKIAVTTPEGTDTSDTNFTVTIPATPSITSFDPASGPVGTTVTITGEHFTGATAVSFNGAVTTPTVNSDTEIEAVVPVGATDGKISVTTPEGSDESDTAFTVTVPLPPSITSFDPVSGGAGAAVTITGEHFTGATAVAFNGTAATFTVNDEGTEIETRVPSGATTGKISVTTPEGADESDTDFTVIPPPRITSFSPLSGIPGTSVTILGTTFTGVTKVTFNGVVASFTFVSDIEILAIVPNTKSGKIAVTALGGTGTSAERFIVPKKPEIKWIRPEKGKVGTTIRIKGKNFEGVTLVTFNGVSATFQVRQNNEISAVVPPGATTGKVAVTNSAGTAVTKKSFAVRP